MLGLDPLRAQGRFHPPLSLLGASWENYLASYLMCLFLSYPPPPNPLLDRKLSSDATDRTDWNPFSLQLEATVCGTQRGHLNSLK